MDNPLGFYPDSTNRGELLYRYPGNKRLYFILRDDLYLDRFISCLSSLSFLQEALGLVFQSHVNFFLKQNPSREELFPLFFFFFSN